MNDNRFVTINNARELGMFVQRGLLVTTTKRVLVVKGGTVVNSGPEFNGLGINGARAISAPYEGHFPIRLRVG